jgi:hypothetical protein
MVDPNLQAAVDAVAKATTDVGTTIKSLDGLITTNMTPADVKTVTDTLTGIATACTAMANDPNVPVPVPVPPPIPAAARKAGPRP